MELGQVLAVEDLADADVSSKTARRGLRRSAGRSTGPRSGRSASPAAAAACSVSTTRSMALFFSRSIAGPDSTPWVAIAHTSVAPRDFSSSAADVMVPAVSIMSSVSTHSRPFDLADDLGRLGHVGRALRPALVAERQVGAAVAEVLGHPLGDLDAPGVGRDDHRRRAVLAQVALEHRHRREVIDRPVEEALDLAGVEVDRDHPLGAGGLEHVGDQAGRDRLAALGLAVLAGVAVERA